MYARAVTRLACLIAVLLGCGANNHRVTEHEEREPAWTAEVTRAVDDACACKDDACIRPKRPSIERTIADHGGIAEAPPGAQVAFQKLETCWHAITRDLARDLGDAADRACACTTGGCWEAELAALDHKYGALDDLRSTAEWTPAVDGAHARITACLQKKTIASADYLALLQGLADTTCGCTTAACSDEQMSAFETKIGAYVNVGSGHESEIAALKDKLCHCVAVAEAGGRDFALNDSIHGKLYIAHPCK